MADSPNNVDKNVSTIVLKKFIKGFDSQRVLSKIVDRQLIGAEINADTGGSVQLKRPMQFETIRTPDGDITGKPKTNLMSGTVTAKVDDYITVAVSYTQLERALKLNQLEKLLSPVAAAMATELETRLGRFAQANGALLSGIPGVSVSQWSDVASTGTLLNALGVTGTNYAILNPFGTQNMANTQTALSSNDLVRSAWEDAQIPRNFGGVRALNSNGLVSRTQGAFGGTLTVRSTPFADYASVKDTYQLTLQLTGATANKAAFLKTGDQLIFPGTFLLNQQNKQQIIGADGLGIPFTGTVMADAASDAGGNITVTISGAPIFGASNQQYNAVSKAVGAGDSVTVSGVANKIVLPNLFMNEQFMGMGSVVLPKLDSIDSTVISFDKLSIRCHKYSDGNANNYQMRFDLLPTFACFNPFLGGQFFGQG